VGTIGAEIPHLVDGVAVTWSKPFMPNHGDATLPAHWGPPYLLYLGNPADDLAIKTARGVAWWRPEWCVGQYRHPDCKLTLGLPDIGMAEARARGAFGRLLDTVRRGAAG